MSKDNISRVILEERIQKALYDNGSGIPEGADIKELGELLALVYLGALKDYYNYPDTSSLLMNEDVDDLLAEPLFFDRAE